MKVVKAPLIKTANPTTLTLIRALWKREISLGSKKDNTIFPEVTFNLFPGDRVHGYCFFSHPN